MLHDKKKSIDMLIEEVDIDKKFKKSLIDLVNLKKEGNELSKGPRIPIIDEFITDNLELLKIKEGDTITNRSEEIILSYNKFFKTIIDKVNHGY